MRSIVTIIALVFAVAGYGEVTRITSPAVVGATNAVSSASATNTTTGFLLKVSVTVNSGAKTNNLIVADVDGTVLLSNVFTSGTTTTWFTNNPVPFQGLVYSAFSANTNGVVTNSITSTINK